MKYNSSSYYKLFKLLNGKILQPSTVDSHFRKQTIEREKELTSSDDIINLLDQYWIDIKEPINEYLIDFNKNFSTNLKVDDLKIKICLGCDV